ncbi:energy transducer TonB [Brevundimonas sp. NPDC003935]
MSSRPSSRNVRLAKASVTVGVGFLHLVLFGLLGRLQPDIAPTPMSRPVEVELVRPSPIPPRPLPPPKPARAEGGGAPAAASRTHSPPRKAERRPELTAPPRPAPQPPLVIGVAPEASPTPGQGLGGEGGGSGVGVGSGAGPGSGGSRFRLLRGPTQADLRAVHPPAAFRRRMGGRVSLSCRIRLDTRLEACRVMEEAPPGLGFGQAALAVSVHFRFQPPVRDGAPVDNQEVPVVVIWP